jgi:hypothetical protein
MKNEKKGGKREENELGRVYWSCEQADIHNQEVNDTMFETEEQGVPVIVSKMVKKGYKEKTGKI